ncbi:hypothetical protein P3L10_028740 [Capsicum annuum]
MIQLLGKVLCFKEYLRKWCKIYNFCARSKQLPKKTSFNYVYVPICVILEKAEKSSYSAAGFFSKISNFGLYIQQRPYHLSPNVCERSIFVPVMRGKEKEEEDKAIGEI